MQMQTQNNLSFGTKIINNDTYNDIMIYALKKNKFSKFLKTIENVDKFEKDIFVKMNLCYTDKFPTVVFSRYMKNKNGDFVLTKQTDYISPKSNKNPVEYALKMFFKLGANRGNNKVYKDVVIRNDKDSSTYFLF